MAPKSSAHADVTYRTPRLKTPPRQGPRAQNTHNEFAVEQGHAVVRSHTEALRSLQAAWWAAVTAKRTKKSPSLGSWAFFIAISVVVGMAWLGRDEGHLTPQTGTGYWLGITGGLLMLSLLLYPLRKSWKRLSQAGSIQLWFTIHMLFGILGPALVLIHSNFRLESKNATVAMGVMALVVVSGLVGRYIYSQLHGGLSGQRAQLSELLDDAEAMRAAFGEDMQHAPDIDAELRAFQAYADQFRTKRFGSFQATLFLGAKSRRSKKLLRAEAEAVLSARALREHWNVETHRECIDAALEHFDVYFVTVRKAASLHFFERLFRFWHVLHFPLFLLLIIVAVGHVVAVHLY
jgi:hypothetical protein